MTDEIDTSYERVFDELRAERMELRHGFRADFVALDGQIDQLQGGFDQVDDRLRQLDDRLRQLDERLGRLGFRANGILAAGMIALVATQL